MSTAHHARRGPWIVAGAAAMLAIAAVVVVLIVVLADRGEGGPITDQSLCRDVNALGSDPNNYEERYLALNQALGSRSGFEQVCRESPNMPVTQALQDAPGAEMAFPSANPT